MRKDYLAVCAGRAPSDVFSIDLPIVTTSRVQRCAPEGRRAIRVRQGTLRYNLGYSRVYCRVYSRVLDAPQRVGAPSGCYGVLNCTIWDTLGYTAGYTLGYSMRPGG